MEKIYNGRGNTSEFLINIEILADLQGFDEMHDWYAFVGDVFEASLIGDALRWYEQLDDVTRTSWSLLRERFRCYYGDRGIEEDE